MSFFHRLLIKFNLFQKKSEKISENSSNELLEIEEDDYIVINITKKPNETKVSFNEEVKISLSEILTENPINNPIILVPVSSKNWDNLSKQQKKYKLKKDKKIKIKQQKIKYNSQHRA